MTFCRSQWLHDPPPCDRRVSLNSPAWSTRIPRSSAARLFGRAGKGDQMARDWESSFTFWAQSPSKTEEERCERVIKAIRAAVAASPKLQQRNIKVFTQGSFRNRVNVRRDSDVDVGVMLYDYFLVQYPDGKGNADFGNRDVENYGFAQFKNELGAALVAHFGRDTVTRGNKAFDIKAPYSQVEADVVPLWEFRQYWELGRYRAGVALLPDSGGEPIENYPERLIESWPATPLHYENGKAKNDETSRRYRAMVRILKSVRIELEAASNPAASIPGYLVECLVWNAPNSCFVHGTWDERVQSVLRFLWNNVKDSNLCDKWCEVDAIKFLFYFKQPWTREKAHAFVDAAWDHVGVRK